MATTYIHTGILIIHARPGRKIESCRCRCSGEVSDGEAGTGGRHSVIGGMHDDGGFSDIPGGVILQKFQINADANGFFLRFHVNVSIAISLHTYQRTCFTALSNESFA